MKRLTDFRKHVIEGWTVQRIAAVLIVVGLVVFVFGAITQYCACVGWPNLGDVLNHMIGDFYANVSVDCLSIAFAILVIDRLNERRDEQELKAQLIREMGSTDNGIATRAVRELRERGWMEDGSLRGAFLMQANLQGAGLFLADLRRAELVGANLQRSNLLSINLEEAFLYEANFKWAQGAEANLRGACLTKADLQGAHLYGSDLREADLRHANLRDAILVTKEDEGSWYPEEKLEDADLLIDQKLALVSKLCGATMPNGERYNGRFNLSGDIEEAKEADIDISDPEAMADWYGVSVAEYCRGQAGISEGIPKSQERELSTEELIESLLKMKEFANENIDRLCREAGLDSDTGLPVEPTNGVEPQPADASAQPAPRRNGHKASMVTHRVRR
jgi:hypothetical protein